MSVIDNICSILGDRDGILATAVAAAPLIESADLPDQIIERAVTCAGVIGDEDDWEDQTPCAWGGLADVAVFEDTQELIWFCPSGHENSLRWPA